MSLEIRTRVAGRLAEHGYKPHQIDGILMNIDDESGFNPTAVGDNGNAFGLFQHNGPRMRQLKSWAGQNGLDYNDPIVQTDFAHHELQTTERGAYEALQATKTAGEAGDVILRKFERPAEVHQNSRSAKYLGNAQPTNSYASTSPETYNSNVQIGGNAPDYYGEAMAFTSGGTPPAQAPAEPPKPKTKIGEFTEKHMPWLTEDRGDMLLAIGTGLLSGDDWASGGAAAGENLMGVRQMHKEREANAAASQAENERWTAAQASQRLEHLERLDQQRALREMDINAATQAAGAEAAAKAAERQAEQAAKDAQLGSYSRTPPAGKNAYRGATAYDTNGTPVFEALKTEGDRKRFGQSVELADSYRTNLGLYEQYGPERMSSATKLIQDAVESNVLEDGSVNSVAAYSAVMAATASDPIMQQIADAQFKATETKLNLMTGAAYNAQQFAGQARQYMILPGDSDDRIRQKIGNIGNDAYNATLPLPVGQDYVQDLISGNASLSKVTIQPYAGTATQPSQPAPGEVRTSTLPAPSEEAVTNEVQRMSAASIETARKQTGYPDAVKAKGTSEQDWYRMVALADQADPNDPDAFTWDDIFEYYGISEDTINNTPVNVR